MMAVTLGIRWDIGTRARPVPPRRNRAQVLSGGVRMLLGACRVAYDLRNGVLRNRDALNISDKCRATRGPGWAQWRQRLPARLPGSASVPSHARRSLTSPTVSTTH